MTTFILIILCVSFVLYLFNNDRKDLKINTLQRGGLVNLYPKFVNYVTQTNSSELSLLNIETSNLILSKNDGEYLEYKFPVIVGNEICGYYFIGIQHSFGTFAYCYCQNKAGIKIEGYISELHNGSNGFNPRDREVDDYRGIFFNLIKQMENIPKFEEKFYPNLKFITKKVVSEKLEQEDLINIESENDKLKIKNITPITITPEDLIDL